jgi:hypothetical protein
MRIGALFLAIDLLWLSGCSEPAAHQPPPENKPAPEAPPPEAPIALKDAPRAYAKLSFLSSADARFSLGHPIDSGKTAPDAAADELVGHDAANDIAGRCTTPGPRAAAKTGKTDAPPPAKIEEIAAEPLKVGFVPESVPRAFANQLIDKTRLWQMESQSFDFYKMLANGHPNGLRPDLPSVGCIRYSMFGTDSELYSDMIFSVTYNPKTPEVLTVAPVRFYYRDFATLSAHSGAREAAVKVTLGMRVFSLDRNAGRLSACLQNQEMAVEIFTDDGAGRAVYDLYDPVSGPNATIPLPPWDYSSTTDNPRHNLSVLGITVTEIADFDWLQSESHKLWPGWEPSATDASKIGTSALFYSHTHMRDAAVSP